MCGYGLQYQWRRASWLLNFHVVLLQKLNSMTEPKPVRGFAVGEIAEAKQAQKGLFSKFPFGGKTRS